MVMVMPPMPTTFLLPLILLAGEKFQDTVEMPTCILSLLILLSGEKFQDTVEKQETVTRAKLVKQYLSDNLSAIRHDSTPVNQSNFARE
jgi:hypothetical protein